MQGSFRENTRKRVLLNSKSKRDLIWLLLFVATFGLVIFSAFSYDKERGKKLYIEQCSKCHRKDGKGIKGIYPPLKNSDYVQKGNIIELLRGMLFGRSGKIVVNGEVYYGVMTTEIDKSLRDEDIALILEFVLRELNGIDKSVSSDDVVKARKLGKLPSHK